MIRFGLLIVFGMITTGCASSGKIVVQDGYRGIAPNSPGTTSGQPGGLTLAPSPTGEIGFSSSQPPVGP